MFGDELIIGSVRAQVNHLRSILDQIETDERWKNHSWYYAKEIYAIEKNLRKIRKADFEPVNKYS